VNEYWTLARILDASDAEVARPERFELPTFWFVAREAIRPMLLIRQHETSLGSSNTFGQ
jgi:hypothetical protein